MEFFENTYRHFMELSNAQKFSIALALCPSAFLLGKPEYSEHNCNQNIKPETFLDVHDALRESSSIHPSNLCTSHDTRPSLQN